MPRTASSLFCSACLWCTASGLLHSSEGDIPQPRPEDGPDWEPGGAGVLALCGIDVTQSVISIGQAGTGLSSAVHDCRPVDKEPADKVICAARVFGVLSAFMDIASFISSAAADCARDLQLQAYCAADVTGLVGSLTNLAYAALELARSCVPQHGEPEEEGGSNETADEFLGRRLGGPLLPPSNESLQPQTSNSTGTSTTTTVPDAATTTRTLSHHRTGGTGEPLGEALSELIASRSEKQLRKAAIADCVFDVNSATAFLARSIVTIDAAAHSTCRGPNATGTGCAVDVAGVIGSFADTAAFVSLAAADCPIKENLGAICAGDIANLISGIAGAISASISFRQTCGQAPLGTILAPQFR